MENRVSQKLWKFSNPVLFKKLANIISPLVGLIAVLAIIIGLVWGVFFTSPDYKQMESVKIIFIHVPAAFLAINIYLMMTITSLVWLIRRHYVSALAAKSSAMIGLTMTIVTIITGSLWGSSTWGTYWVWDPRLTSFAILLCFYIGYILLWQAIGSIEKAANITSLFCIIGSVFALLSRYIVFFIDQGLHQGPTLSLDQEKNIDNSYYFPLILTLIGFSSLFIYLVLVRTTTEINKFKLKSIG